MPQRGAFKAALQQIWCAEMELRQCPFGCVLTSVIRGRFILVLTWLRSLGGRVCGVYQNLDESVDALDAMRPRCVCFVVFVSPVTQATFRSPIETALRAPHCEQENNREQEMRT